MRPAVTARQRTGTVKGFSFLSIEDGTDIANHISTSDLYERQRLADGNPDAQRDLYIQNIEVTPRTLHSRQS